MKTFLSTLLLSSLLLAGSAAAVEVGDIYYSDKTFSSSVQSGKKAIGVVYWVSTNKDFGYIVALEEAPSTMNVFNANVHCLEYYTEGTLAGDWKLPQRIELVRLGKYRVNNTTVNNYAKINITMLKSMRFWPKSLKQMAAKPQLLATKTMSPTPLILTQLTLIVAPLAEAGAMLNLPEPNIPFAA